MDAYVDTKQFLAGAASVLPSEVTADLLGFAHPRRPMAPKQLKDSSWVFEIGSRSDYAAFAISTFSLVFNPYISDQRAAASLLRRLQEKQ